MLNVLIAVPTHDNLSARFCYCLQDLVRYTTERKIRFEVRFEMGTVLSSLRETLADYALIHKFTHILWLDSDMTYPSDTLERLLAYDLDVVSCSYNARVAPYQSVAYIHQNGQYVPLPDTAAPALIPVISNGMGCMLCSTNVLTRMDKPRFPITYVPDGEYYQGEDVNFCLKLQQLDIKVYVDTQLSAQVGHVGSIVC